MHDEVTVEIPAASAKSRRRSAVSTSATISVLSVRKFLILAHIATESRLGGQVGRKRGFGSIAKITEKTDEQKKKGLSKPK